MLSEAFVSVLRSGRADFNAQFVAARRQLPELDAEVFKSFLQTTVDPWVAATHATRSDRVAAVAMAAYEVALEIVGLRLAGPGSRSRSVDAALRRVLPAAAAVCADEPLEAMSSIANAAHQLESTPSARVGAWVERMERLSPRARDLPELLRLGQLLAWHAGLAHYRGGALAVADALPEDLVLSALDAPPGASWATERARLAADPWYVPGRRTGGPEVVHVAGAFRGLGGLFIEPPRLAWSDGALLVRSGSDAWVLAADAFGATFHRASGDEIARARAQLERPRDLALTDGVLSWRGKKLTLPLSGLVTSTVVTPTTLGVTTNQSHAVALVALGGAG